MGQAILASEVQSLRRDLGSLAARLQVCSEWLAVSAKRLWAYRCAVFQCLLHAANMQLRFVILLTAPVPIAVVTMLQVQVAPLSPAVAQLTGPAAGAATAPAPAPAPARAQVCTCGH
jgi:hypothetical protein